MDNTAAAEVLEAIAASAAGLAGVLRGTAVVSAAQPSVGDGDLLRQQAEACLTVLSGTAGMEAMMAAVKVHAANGYDHAAQAVSGPVASPGEQTAQDRGILAEVACALTVSERTANALLAEAHELTTALPLTLAALEAGSISWQHARIVVDETANLDPAGTAALEAHFLDPDAPNPARGGPAWLSAYLPAGQAAGIRTRTTAAARTLQGPTESRTLTRLRADIAAAWLLGGEADAIPSPKAQVLVTVPVFALMSLTDEPAMLDGYGPIPPSMARALVAGGADSFHRVLTDPRDGAPLEIGRDSYRIPTAMRRWLRLRDGKCPFPGCHNQSLDNEADHLLAWHQGGTTGIANLGQPCPRHHRLKHTTTWRPTPASPTEPPGWISPADRHYASEHPDWEPTIWPQQLEDPGFGAALELADQERTGQERTDEERCDAQAGGARTERPVDSQPPVGDKSPLDWVSPLTTGMHSVT
ncbi:DUF222 domain-containing protein [Arthrobacter sp. UYCo732]|uniref:HNH endonuclease signature motif containing protein n=1 Tax=Arthrobacter sp. UYCo732 TaxID=3156336 RepID=UPI003390DAAD